VKKDKTENATGHTTDTTMTMMCMVFGNTIISNGHWPP